jgi:hypothetical protein
VEELSLPGLARFDRGALLEPHVKVLDIMGKSMKGSVLVESESVVNDDLMKGWITLAMKFVGKTPRK